MPKFTVTLNGTNTNPYERLGLTRNAFPQLARHEYMPLSDLLARLEAKPIADEAALRKRLEGASSEFIELCVSQFKPGERVSFDCSFPD